MSSTPQDIYKYLIEEPRISRMIPVLEGEALKTYLTNHPVQKIELPPPISYLKSLLDRSGEILSDDIVRRMEILCSSGKMTISHFRSGKSITDTVLELEKEETESKS